MTTPVDTRQVPDRRVLHFANSAEVLADARQLEAAEKEGRVRRLGNWTLGQAINHLAVWAEYAFTGTPITPPWFVRLVGPLIKKRMLNKGLPAGVRIPKVPGGTLGMEAAPTHAAIDRLRAAMDRLERETPEKPNNVFGRLTRAEWVALQLRHAELHLSFFKP